MFDNQELKEYIEDANVIKTRSLVSAEINLNIADNIKTIGNYRYRPHETVSLSAGERSIYATLINSFDQNDEGNFYTGATDADVVVDGGIDEDNIPLAFKSNKQKEKLIFSLEECFGRFRPRSGINKARFFNDRYIPFVNQDMAQRPRYYIPHKNDKFKYWSSYRTESITYEYVYPNGIIQYGTSPQYDYLVDGELVVKPGKPLSSQEVGISNNTINDNHYISDAAPFVVYENQVPANRIVVKMQTGIGASDLGTFSGLGGDFEDPFFGQENSSTPSRWRIQYLQNNIWTDAIVFDENSIRDNGQAIIGPDGYVEVYYGVKIPEQYRGSFYKAGEYVHQSLLPDTAVNGQAYLVRSSSTQRGTYYVWMDGKYESFVPEYGWSLIQDEINLLNELAEDLTNPPASTNLVNGNTEYEEFQYVSGLRVVAETMNKQNATFDLIELSPRLGINLSDKMTDYSVTKQMSDVGITGLPVGQLLAGTGSATVFDFDLAFSPSNSSSIIADYVSQNIQFKFYEAITGVDNYDYYIPIKTLYSEGFPETSNTDRTVSLELRDLFFYFESLDAPEILLTDTSISFAIATVLDSIGFSNYVFLRTDNEDEPLIPYFYVPRNTTVAEILEQIAISTQYAMFFDEYNNFVVMSKNYVLPDANQRELDSTLYGSVDSRKSGIIKNEPFSNKSNIIELSSQTRNIYNDGQIDYSTKYIQRSYSSIRQASLIDRQRTWIYKPVLLWEVSGTEQTKTINEETGEQSKFVLSAIPIQTDLSDELPYVDNHIVQSNTIDFGEGIYWVSRYSGYFYANGEIIRYDAVQYSVPGLGEADGVAADGTVWITSNQEYRKYFSKLPFNGKMYPTGLARIYSEPNYEIVNNVAIPSNGEVAVHGRGQFGTKVVYHNAGLNEYWSDPDTLRGCVMESGLLFSQSEFDGTTFEGIAGIYDASGTSRNGIIKNHLSSSYPTETEVNRFKSTQSGTIQSSALVMTGKTFASTEKPVDHIAYTYKQLDDSYKFFGTRMRLIGRIQNSEERIQSPSGSSSYYTVPGSKPDESIVIGASSGGMGIMVNPSTNAGYYFEIAALTAADTDQYEELDYVHNVIFYKILAGQGESKAIPVKLYGGLANILVDDGNFAGQYRMASEKDPTVFDLGVQYQDIGNTRRFYLYINNNLIATVDDEDPLTNVPNMSLFIRGTARAMFENIFALTKDYSENISASLELPTSTAFGDSNVSVSESFRKYAMSGVIQSTYLSSLSPSEGPKYNMYFEEFGTIMREAHYFNVKYDKAYPALYSKIAPTFNRVKGYTVSGFLPTAYGAEFLIFNATDTALSLDETSGNYLRILGVTFTESSDSVLTVDQYFSKLSDLSRPEIAASSAISSPLIAKEKYFDIKTSRMTYGKKEFSLTAPFIQSQDDANSLMAWLTSKIMKPRLSVGVSVFPNPMIQLGDIVNIEYKDNNNVDVVAPSDKKFVVYNIEYSRSTDGPSMNLYLSEVNNG